MAEMVAGAFLTAAFENLFERLASRVALFLQGKEKNSIEEQLRKLELNLKKADLLLNVAEDKQIYDHNIKKWLVELKDIIFKADDLVEDIDAEAQSEELERRESGGSTASLQRIIKSIGNHFFAKVEKTEPAEIANILEDFESLLSDKTVVLRLEEDAKTMTRSSSRMLRPAPLRDEHHVYGRDVDKEEIFKSLLSDDISSDKIGVLSIVGMGGLGKTTLAQLVFDDNRVKERGFQLKAWVTVSTEFDSCRIIKTILQQVNSKIASSVEEPMELQQRLREALRGKKFFFVLDDVWEENYDSWDFLKSNFVYGECGSRIIVTTRSEKVSLNVHTGRIHVLKQISDDDCWQIFVDHAFSGDLDANPCLQEIGKKIVNKCKGLPLAVKSVGGLLRSERNQPRWERILTSPVWEWSETQNNNILPSLWLSYCYLPSYLKQCFAYCSAFPKDFEFQKKKMVLLWMAEGFLQSTQREKRFEEVGEEYFNDLVSRSLFQRSSQDESAFVMHDLVHDVATFVAREFCSRPDSDNNNLKRLTSKTRHLIAHSTTIDDELCSSLSKAKHLHTFIALGPYLHSSGRLAGKLKLEGRYLRVLSPSKQSQIHSFSDMKHLRYLDLSGSEVEEIPCSLCTLYNLQTLLLSNCRRLTQLPANMGRLINLRHLDTTSTPLKEMPPQMDNLKELQTLTDFVLGASRGSSIKELGELHHLGGKLCISGLHNVIGVEDVLKSNLREKANLRELWLKWESNNGDTKSGDGVLGALEPHTNLNKLMICDYAASSFPHWIGDPLFCNLVSIRLSGNRHCSSLPPLGQLPSLRVLVVISFHKVETIGAEFYGNTSSFIPFRSLETLSFSDMPKWNRWLFMGDDIEGGNFPCLKHIRLDRCPNLTGTLPDAKENLEIKQCNVLVFPGIHQYTASKLLIRECDSLNSLPLDHFPRLKELEFQKCRRLESLSFSEEAGNALHSLGSLRLINCDSFKSLPRDMHRTFPSLAFIEMFKCPEIECFPEGGLPHSLDELVISDCRKLLAQHGHWNLQGLTCLRSLRINYCDVERDSFPEGLLPSSLTSFKLGGLGRLRSLNGDAFQNTASLETLSLWYCDELRCLPQEVFRNSLHVLDIYECPFLERRYRRGKRDWNNISHIPKIWINGQATRTEDDRTEDAASTNV